MSSLSEQLQNLGFRANETTAETASEAVQIDKSQVVRLQRQTKGR